MWGVALAVSDTFGELADNGVTRYSLPLNIFVVVGRTSARRAASRVARREIRSVEKWKINRPDLYATRYGNTRIK